jgi:hypothetical protein
MHVCMGVYDLALGCVFEIAHRGYVRVLYRSSLTTCVYSLGSNPIGAEGVQHIAAALAHNSTLQVLK